MELASSRMCERCSGSHKRTTRPSERHGDSHDIVACRRGIFLRHSIIHYRSDLQNQRSNALSRECPFRIRLFLLATGLPPTPQNRLDLSAPASLGSSSAALLDRPVPPTSSAPPASTPPPPTSSPPRGPFHTPARPASASTRSPSTTTTTSTTGARSAGAGAIAGAPLRAVSALERRSGPGAGGSEGDSDTDEEAGAAAVAAWRSASARRVWRCSPFLHFSSFSQTVLGCARRFREFVVLGVA